MGLQRRMARWADEGNVARVAVAGAGFVGGGLVHRLLRTPGLTPSLMVSRTPQRAVDAFRAAGCEPAEIEVSDDPDRIAKAIDDGRPAVSTAVGLVSTLDSIDVVVEATGALDVGGTLILGALEAGKDVVSMNAEVDALLGHLFHGAAGQADAVYTIADGDQPGVLLRQIEFVAGMGFQIVAAVNCKRHLDIRQNPHDSAAYAQRDGTSMELTTATGDGTKMQIENAVVANVTGLVPDRRGMHGVTTTVARAAADVAAVLSRDGVVEYTLGGDFGGGVGVVARAEDPEIVDPFMRYAKMGNGPEFFFFRPYHLVHLEMPVTIGEVVLDRQGLGDPGPRPVAEVVAMAKRDLRPGDELDGIGGFTCYGHVDTAEGARGLLPIGLAGHAHVTRPVAMDDPVPLDAVEIDEDAVVVRLRRRQEQLLSGSA
jgi:predicted homoserine dehydrogenase-like protein